MTKPEFALLHSKVCLARLYPKKCRVDQRIKGERCGRKLYDYLVSNNLSLNIYAEHSVLGLPPKRIEKPKKLLNKKT